MSTEKQFLSWLNRKEKSFRENLNFAIKSWRSVEFSFTKKYEIILGWIAIEGAKQNELPNPELHELLGLRVQATFISLQAKLNLVEMIIEHSKKSKSTTRDFTELLCKLLAVEWLQDLLRSNHDIKAQVYGTLLKCYEKYLNNNNISKEAKLTAQETELFVCILNLFKGHMQNAIQLEQLVKAYDIHIVQPLTQVFLILRSKYGIDFFEELREIEQPLRVCDNETINQLLLEMPTHSALIILECAVANHRIEQNFFQSLLECVFSSSEVDIKNDKKLLIKAAYTLNMFRKHNVSLNFSIKKINALNFIGNHIYEYANLLRDTNLNDVLLLLCSALRLNPLILEKHIFELTTWMIVASKTTEDIEKTNVLFEEYLILLLEMFRRLSRAEKFVVNLLKALNKWLDENELQKIPSSTKKQIKRKLDSEVVSPNKRIKTNLKGEKLIFSSKDEAFQSYMEMIFVDFNKQNQALKHTTAPQSLENSFTQLQTSWPSSSIGYAFSRLITGLVTKASLTIWKTLLYALKDQLNNLSKENAALDMENAYFRLDIHAALLCQYFAGSKLIEQYEKYAKEIKQQRELTNEILATFGKFVLNHSYHKRRVNAFLECCYNAANFELLLAYYKPDGLEDDSLSSTELVPNLHAYLTMEEWSTMQQQILNNGKEHCRVLYDRILLQRLEAQQLLQETTAKTQKKLMKTLGCADDITSLAQFIAHSPHAHWLIEQLNRNQKIQLMSFKCQDLKSLNDDNFLEIISRNSESLELLVLAIFEKLQIEFKSNCKTSLFAALKCDFDSIRECHQQNNQDFHKIIKSIVGIIKEYPTVYKMKISEKQTLNAVLNYLQTLPLSCLRRQMKSLIFVFYLAIYEDLKLAQAEDETKQLFECITDFLHFGQQVPIFRYFDMSKILQLLPISECWEFYKFLFSTIKNEEKGTDEFLKAMYDLLSNAFNESKTLNNEEQRLLLIAIDSLSNLDNLIARRMHKHLEAFLSIYGNYVYSYFEKENSAKKNKKFVEKTLSGFAPFAKSILITVTNNNKIDEDKEEGNVSTISSKEQRKSLKPLDEDFRKICKIYIGYSMDYRNPYAIRLMQVALKHRKLLHLDQDEIELVLTGYWRQLNTDMKHKTFEVSSKDDSFQIEDNLTSNSVATNLETLMKIIIDNKTNEDLLLTLKEIGNNVKDEQSFLNALEILSLIGKSKFSTIKGAIFNAQFKEITSHIILRLQRNEQQRFTQHEVILKLLHLQQICVDNKSISLTPDALDTIIAFLIEINIKKLSVTDTNSNEFFVLHTAMTSLCTTIVKQRHILLMDRVPQFMHIFKDLLQAIIQYKSERQKDTALETKELDELAELALKLEVLMHNIATHSTDVKRVAPFVLIFGINLMVTCKRPTTLYSKIKTHIEAIYYSLIGICDHRVGHFILRCSNEAARQTYELLVKNHKKYHKFKGKV